LNLFLKLLLQGIELFHQSPSKRIQFLRESGLIDANNIEDLVKFLKQTPALDKKQIGDYVSSRKNVNILAAFVKYFVFFLIKLNLYFKSSLSLV
jgi:Sec7-like guanine-nucleotide exchange factor